MADKVVSKPAEPPKPVHVGGESFIDRVRPHIKEILIGTSVVAVVLIAIFAVKAFREHNETVATEDLDHTLELGLRPVRAKDAPVDPNQPSFANPKDRAVALLAKSGTEAAGAAYRGGLLLDAGKPDDAIAEYRKGLGDKTIEGVLCREGLGIALETKAGAEKDPAARQKGLEEALAAFAAMQPDEAGMRRAYALYHQGRIQLLLGKRAEAKALFESARLANKDPNAEVAPLIEKRLATLGAS